MPRDNLMYPLPPGLVVTEPVSPHLGVCLAHSRRISLDCPTGDVPVVSPVTVLNTQLSDMSWNYIAYMNIVVFCRKGRVESSSWIVVGYNK